MARRLLPLPADEVAERLARLDAGTAGRDDVKALTKHFLGVLVEIAPGASVEVRVPPYAAVQCIPGGSHTRGTPPAVVEMDAPTWIALARGTLSWRDARLRASGERSDLSSLLPLA